MHFNRSILKQHEKQHHDERYALTEHSFAQELDTNYAIKQLKLLDVLVLIFFCLLF